MCALFYRGAHWLATSVVETPRLTVLLKLQQRFAITIRGAIPLKDAFGRNRSKLTAKGHVDRRSIIVYAMQVSDRSHVIRPTDDDIRIALEYGSRGRSVERQKGSECASQFRNLLKHRLVHMLLPAYQIEEPDPRSEVRRPGDRSVGWHEPLFCLPDRRSPC